MTSPMSPIRHVTAERVSEWLDGDISEREAAAVRSHVAACPACADLVSELRGQADSLRELGRPEPPATLWSAIEGIMDGEDARAERRRWSWPSWLAGALGGAVTATIAVWLVVGGRAGTVGPAGTTITARSRWPEVIPPLAPPLNSAISGRRRFPRLPIA